MSNIKIIINDKEFSEILAEAYLNRNHKREPIEVRSWCITKNNMLRAGSFELDKDCINPSMLELFNV